MKYRDFRLTIRALDDGYRAEAEFEDLSGVHTFQVKEHWLAPVSANRMEQIGREMFETIFDQQIGEVFHGAWSGTRKDGNRGLRIQLHLSIETVKDRVISCLPWEFLYFSARSSYLVLLKQVSLVRKIRTRESAPPLKRPDRFRLLIVFCNALPEKLLKGEREITRIQEALQGEPVDIHVLRDPSFSQLGETMRQAPYHFFHFIGHGRFFERNGKGVLFFGGADSREEVDSERMTRLFQASNTLRLVFLNACESARSGSNPENDPKTATTIALLASGVPAVLSMSREIGDRDATQFAATFYQGLGEGKSLEEAVFEARHQVAILSRSSMDWGFPVLFMQTEDLFGHGDYDVTESGSVPLISRTQIMKAFKEVKAAEDVAKGRSKAIGAVPEKLPKRLVAVVVVPVLIVILIVSFLTKGSWLLQESPSLPIRLVFESNGAPLSATQDGFMDVLSRLDTSPHLIVTSGEAGASPEFRTVLVRHVGSARVAPSYQFQDLAGNILGHRVVGSSATDLMEAVKSTCDLLGVAYSGAGQLWAEYEDQAKAAQLNETGLQAILDQAPADARIAFENALTAAPEFTPALRNLAVLDLADGQYQKAYDRLDKLCRLNPKLPDHHYLLGYAARRKGDLKAAIGALTQALALDPAHLNARNELALIYLAEGLAGQALPILKDGLRYHPGYWIFHKNLGLVELELKDPQAALASLDQAVRRMPEDQVPHRVVALAARARAAVRLAQKERARLDLEEIHRLDPAGLFYSASDLEELNRNIQ